MSTSKASETGQKTKYKRCRKKSNKRHTVSVLPNFNESLKASQRLLFYKFTKKKKDSFSARRRAPVTATSVFQFSLSLEFQSDGKEPKSKSISLRCVWEGKPTLPPPCPQFPFRPLTFSLLSSFYSVWRRRRGISHSGDLLKVTSFFSLHGFLIDLSDLFLMILLSQRFFFFDRYPILEI